MPCKHIFAVQFAVSRERGSDGKVTETRTMTFTQKTTCAQNWPAYNLAQTTEKHRFQVLLRDLCEGIPELLPAKTGRRPIPLADRLFACTYKVYSTVSSRRFACDLNDAHEDGYLSRPLHCN